MKRRILVVDDDPTVRSLLSKYLQKIGYDFRTAPNLADMWKRFRSRRFDAVLLDMMLPDGNSLDDVEKIRAEYPHLTIVMITANADIPNAVEAMRSGADNFLAKPVNLSSLDVFLRQGFEAGAGRQKKMLHARKRKQRAPFAGTNPLYRKMWEMAELAAQNESAVLLLGETGTGKGIAARWIHEHSSRSSQPRVDLNCSGLKGEMLASELFGHVKGAFTSAVSDKSGLIELASNGTLFLDEIGDMDMDVQARFLKVIEEKSYRRVGDVQERFSEFRLICATNQDLSKACKEERFREDLFFRINVFPIMVPALRDVRSDIPDLIRYLLNELAPGVDFVISKKAMTMLKAHSWPGNIREMRNLLERSLLLASKDGRIEAAHFPGLGGGEGVEAPMVTGLNLNELEQDRIREAMKQSDGNVEQAAILLGMSRATLYRKLKKSDSK